jgi:phage portal protein BeeE
MRLADRFKQRYRAQGYWEGMASGAAVLMTYGGDDRKEIAAQQLIAAAQQALATNGIVAAIIQVRMMLLAEAVFKYRNKVDKSLYGDEALRLLEYPWPNGTTGDLWARMEQDDSVAGNAFIWKAEPDRLVRLPPGEIIIISEINRTSDGRWYREPIGYDWDPSMGTGVRSEPAQTFTVDEVSHWAPYPDPLANFRGMSWLTPVLREVGADSGMTTYKNMYLDHGTPIAAVKYPARLKPETIDSAVERLQAKYGGVGNAFKPLIFDQGADPMLGTGLKDLDYAAVQAAGAERICSAGGVDPIILGLTGTVRVAGQAYADAMRRFADLTARPLWRSGCAALEKFVPVPPKGVQLWFDTSDIAALQQAETERAQVTQVNMAAILTGVQAGYTRESVTAAVVSADLSQLKADPNAPPPGTQGGRTGTPPGGGQVLTQAQTPASKTPQPASIPDSAALTSASAKNPSMNGAGGG